MRLGYNTNGFAHHDPVVAIELLAEIGYRSVALTLDHGLLNPFGQNLQVEIKRYNALLEKLQLRSVVETGARYLLDLRVKHEPTLVSTTPAERTRRIDFLKRAIDIAVALKSDCVSLWSGTVRDEADRETTWNRLIEGLKPVLDHAESRQMTIGFEPEPGMFIDTMASYVELTERLPHPRLKLTLDIGHLHCLGEVPIAEQIKRFGSQLVNVHIEDMRAGIHEHLMFGDGEIDFVRVIAALKEVAYPGGLQVELSRHSHMAFDAARQAYAFLQPLVK